MGNKAYNPQQQRFNARSRHEVSSHFSTDGQLQSQTLSIPPQFPNVMTALPDSNHHSSPERPPNVFTMSTPEQDVTAALESPNAIEASPIPEVYYSNDMVHIDSSEPVASIDSNIPMYVTAAGELSQAYPEADPYITNYVELYGIPPPPPLSDPNGIHGNIYP